MAAIERTNGPITYEDSIKAAREELAKAVEAGENLLMPTDSLNNVPAMHKVSIERIKLSPNPDDKDVYPQGKRFALTKEGLLKLSSCAGVQWDYSFSGRTDPMNNPDYISYRVVGAVQRLDGSWLPLQGAYDLDFLVIEEQAFEGKKETTKTWKNNGWDKMTAKERDAACKKLAHDDVLAIRRHKVARCETGAMLRAIRGLLNVKGTYSAAELQKPFVIARLAFQPDYADPIIKAQAVALAFKAMQGVFGLPQGQAQFQPRALPGSSIDMQPTDSGGYEMPEAERCTDEPGPGQFTQSEWDQAAHGSVVAPEQLKTQYARTDKPGKVKIIEDLIKRKGYSITKLAKPVDEYSEEKLMPFFEHLMSLPDVAPADDDIPL